MTGNENTRIKANIGKASQKHAQNIVDAFVDEYVKYYGKYVDANKLEQFIGDMPDNIDTENLPEEMLWTVEDETKGDFVGAGAIKFDDNLAELGSTIILPDYRKSVTPEGRGVYDKLFGERVKTAAELKEEGAVDLVNTQLLADKSAATQHTADKHGFAVTGIYNKKFPTAYEGKGRVTVVDMLWADSRISNTQDEIYVPEKAEGLVSSALDNIQNKRGDGLEEITRRVLNESEPKGNQMYSVRSKEVDKPEGDPMNFAEVSVIADDEGDYTWGGVLREISDSQRAVRQGDDFWVGVSLDTNNPSGMDAAQYLHDLGFEYVGFNPGKLDAGEESQDALELQYCPSIRKHSKQFVDEAAQLLNESSLEYKNADEETGYDSSQALEV